MQPFAISSLPLLPFFILIYSHLPHPIPINSFICPFPGSQEFSPSMPSSTHTHPAAFSLRLTRLPVQPLNSSPKLLLSPLS